MRLGATDGIEPVPASRRTLGLFDQTTLWANLGVSLVGLVTGALLVPALSVWQALLVVATGGVIGGVLLGASAWLGSATALPGMAILRRALGRRGSSAPTILNVAQLIGWSAVETWTVAESARTLIGHGPRLPYYLAAGGCGLALALIGPWSMVRRLLRRYVTPLLLVALAYLLLRVALRAHYHALGSGGLRFMFALDLVIAYNASWLPLAPDYTRYSPDRLRAALGTAIGYFAGTSLVMVIGLLAATLSAATTTTSGAILALTGFAGGFIATAVVVADESEKTFANVYSTAVSFQNLAPRCPQRLAIVVISIAATLIAYQLSVSDYINFLYLLGAVFVPLFGAVIADWLDQPAPVLTVAAWLIGFLSYEWLNPSQVGWVSELHRDVTDGLGLPTQLLHGGVGSSLPAYAAAFGLRLAAAAVRRLRPFAAQARSG